MRDRHFSVLCLCLQVPSMAHRSKPDGRAEARTREAHLSARACVRVKRFCFDAAGPRCLEV